MAYGYAFDGDQQTATVSTEPLVFPGAIAAAIQTTTTNLQVLLTVFDGYTLFGHSVVNRMLSVTLENNQIGVLFFDADGSKKIQISSSDTLSISDGAWHTIALHFSDFSDQGLGGVTFYKDGAKLDTQPFSAEEGFANSFKGKIAFGNNSFYTTNTNNQLSVALVEKGNFSGLITEVKVWSNIPGYAPQFNWPCPTDSPGLVTYITYWPNCQDGYTQLPSPPIWNPQPIFNQFSDSLLNYRQPFPALDSGDQPKSVTTILSQLASNHLIPDNVNTLIGFRTQYTSNVSPFADIRQGVLSATNTDDLDANDFKTAQTQLANELLGVEMIHNYSSPMSDFVRDYYPNAQQALQDCQNANFAPANHTASVMEDDAFALAKALAELVIALATNKKDALQADAPKSTGNAAMSVLSAAFRFILDAEGSVTESHRTESEITAEIDVISSRLVQQYDQKIGNISTNIGNMCKNWGSIQGMINYPDSIVGFPYVMNSDLGSEIRKSCQASYAQMIVGSAYDLWIFDGLDSDNSLPRYFFDSENLNTWFTYYEYYYSQIWQRNFWRGYAVCNFDNPNNSFINSPSGTASSFLEGLCIDMPYILKYWALPVKIYQQSPGPGDGKYINIPHTQ